MFDPRQISLETERLGPRRVEGLKKEDEEWQKKAHAAVLAIQDLTVKFFEATTRAQKGNCAAGACMSEMGMYDSSIPLCFSFIRADARRPEEVWPVELGSRSGAHGAAAVRSLQRNPAADEGQRNLPGTEETCPEGGGKGEQHTV